MADDPAFTTPHPYSGRLDVCPWCRTRPSVLVTPPNRRRIECVNEKCKVQPMSYSFDTVAEAAGSWNYLVIGRGSYV